jgi:hypothetical protein
MFYTYRNSITNEVVEISHSMNYCIDLNNEELFNKLPENLKERLIINGVKLKRIIAYAPAVLSMNRFGSSELKK